MNVLCTVATVLCGKGEHRIKPMHMTELHKTLLPYLPQIMQIEKKPSPKLPLLSGSSCAAPSLLRNVSTLVPHKQLVTMRQGIWGSWNVCSTIVIQKGAFVTILSVQAKTAHFTNYLIDFCCCISIEMVRTLDQGLTERDCGVSIKSPHRTLFTERSKL